MEPREKAASLPERPGVYLFKDAAGTVLYVGKATSLRTACAPTFSNPAGKTPRPARWSAKSPTSKHRRRQRARSAGARKQSHQAAPAQVQRTASRRQDLSIHQAHRVRKISARLLHAQSKERRLALLRPIFPAGLARRILTSSTSTSGPVLQRRSHPRSSAPVPAVLHQALPRALRRRPCHRRSATPKLLVMRAVSRRQAPRPDEELEAAHGCGLRSRSSTSRPPLTAICSARWKKSKSASALRQPQGDDTDVLALVRRAAASRRESVSSARRPRRGSPRILLGRPRRIRSRRNSSPRCSSSFISTRNICRR